MNLYSFSSYKVVIIEIDCQIAKKMIKNGDPIYLDRDQYDEDQVYAYYMYGRLVFSEMFDSNKIHIIPTPIEEDPNSPLPNMRIYTLDRDDVVSVKGWF